MEKRKILVAGPKGKMRSSLVQVLQRLGHEVAAEAELGDAADSSSFDMAIESRLSQDSPNGRLLNPAGSVAARSNAKLCADCCVAGGVFRIDATNFLRRRDNSFELRRIVRTVLDCASRAFKKSSADGEPERIEFLLPTLLSLMDSVLNYLTERAERKGIISPDRSNLFVALDEAFVNAVKHGNRNDPSKLIRITALISRAEARFTVQDEGEGFDPYGLPDPCDPSNLFNTGGRGVLLICSIMDEVKYNDSGNMITMVKRPDSPLGATSLEPASPVNSASNS